FIIFSRTMFAMGRSGALPAALARVHPKFGTPYIALVVALVVLALALALPTDLTTLFLALSIPSMLQMTSTCLCAMIVATRHPEIYEAARFKLGKLFTVCWAGLGIVAAITLLVLGWGADWKPYLALGVWAALGLIYYAGRSFFARGAK